MKSRKDENNLKQRFDFTKKNQKLADFERSKNQRRITEGVIDHTPISLLQTVPFRV